MKTPRYATIAFTFFLLSLLPTLGWAQPAATPSVPSIDKGAAFLARFPKLPATATQIGNSGSGTSARLPLTRQSRMFHDGVSYVRLAIPFVVDRVGLDPGPDGRVLIRLHSPNNEGGWHDTFVDPLTGKVVGGFWDFAWPRLDKENRTPENAWSFATSFWWQNRLPGTSGDWVDNKWKFMDVPKGKGKGVQGYEWDCNDAGFWLTTPKGLKIYGCMPFETVVTDPLKPGLVFSRNAVFDVNWSYRGSGREVRDFAPSYDYAKYPNDPRKQYGGFAGPGPIGAVRPFGSRGDMYVLFGEKDVLVHRWDATAKLLVPAAALAFSPKSMPAAIPNHPSINWGQGAIARFGSDGKFTGAWEVIPDLYKLMPVSSRDPLRAIDPRNGDLYLTPGWQQKPTQPMETTVDRWRTFVKGKPIFSVDEVSSLPLPDHFKSADKCEQIRIDWQTGDLYAVVQREGFDGYRLELYRNWLGATDAARKALLPVYSVGPVCYTVRGNYEWWQIAPREAFGTMAVLGGYVFIAEAQHMGLRVHRASDGAIVGRAFDDLHTNATIDNRTQIQVTESPTEFRVFLMDFHGKSALCWRIPKASLLASLREEKP